MKEHINHFYKACVALALFLVSLAASAQITVQEMNPPNYTLDSIVRSIVGSGIQISNITSNLNVNVPNNQIGTFVDASATPVTGIASGMVLSTGGINTVAGGNDVPNNPSPWAGDPQLQALMPNDSLFHLSMVEFDFTPLSDTVVFNYVFGSKEYPSFTCSNYNDVFGFFIDGPGLGTPTNPINIALVPGTNDYVSINNVNNGGSSGNSCSGPPWNAPNGVNPQYFVSNYNNALNFGYPGFTVKLQAKVAVQACQTYHLKLAITDVGDGSFDSFVFIEEGSLTGVGAQVEPNFEFERFNTAIEGCNNGEIQFIRGDCPGDLTVRYSIGGTATMGLDYDSIPMDSVVIPAGIDTVFIPIIAIADGIYDPYENIVITILDRDGNPTNMIITMEIREEFDYDAGCDYNVCGSDSLQLNPSPFAPTDSYLWNPSTALSCDTCASPYVRDFPQDSINYILTVTDGPSGCIGKDTLSVNRYRLKPLQDTTACEGQLIQLISPVYNATFCNPNREVNYYWNNNPTVLNNPNASVDTAWNYIHIMPDTTRDYTLTVEIDTLCVLTSSMRVEVNPLPDVPADEPLLCFGDSMVIDFKSIDPLVTGSSIFPKTNVVLNSDSTVATFFPRSHTFYSIELFTDFCVGGTGYNFRVSDSVMPYFVTNYDGISPAPVEVSLNDTSVTTRTQNIVGRRYVITHLETGQTDTIISTSPRNELDELYTLRNPGEYLVGLEILVRNAYNQQADTCFNRYDTILNITGYVPLEVMNIITANDDDMNSYLHVKGTKYPTDKWQMHIYNRWGKEVFSTDDYDNETNHFDGSNNASGTYFYQLTVNPAGRTYKGWFQLLK